MIDDSTTMRLALCALMNVLEPIYEDLDNVFGGTMYDDEFLPAFEACKRVLSQPHVMRQTALDASLALFAGDYGTQAAVQLEQDMADIRAIRNGDPS
jgi:hypothetical protein